MHNNSLEYILEKAKEYEKKYRWLQAAENYGKVASLADEDFIDSVKFLENMGFSYYKAAMQAPTNEGFKKRITLAIQKYNKGIELLKKRSEEPIQIEINNLLALIAYASSCLETDPLEKKKLLHEWWNLKKQVKEEYENIGDLYSVARICNDLVEYSTYDWLWSSSTFSETKEIYEECISLTERSIPILIQLDDDYELGRAYCFGSWYYAFSAWYWESEDKIINYFQKAKDYSKKALELAHEIGDAWLISASYMNLWAINLLVNRNPRLAIEPAQKILKYGKIAKDNWCIGWGHVLTACSIIFHARQLEDPDKQRQAFEKSIKMIHEAEMLFQRIHSVHELQVSYNQYALALENLAEIEPNQKTKIALLKKFNKLIREKKEFFKDREVVISLFSGQLSLNILQLAKIETEIERKRALLLDAKSHSEQQISYSMEMHPFYYEARSGDYFTLAMILRELASIEPNSPQKINLFNQAAISIRKSLELSQKRKKIIQSAWGSGAYFGKYYYYLGKFLQEIHFLTKDKKRIVEAIDAYKKTVFYMKKAGLQSRTAESYWHLAQIYEQLTNFKEASNNYKLASKAYDLAAQNIPKLEAFYNNYSQYMLAWDQIQKAKQSHFREDYNEATLHYNEAASLFERSELWSYLSPNYFAWASMEEAEGLSRKENAKQAREAFQKAIGKFTLTEKSITEKIEKVISAEEKELNQKLLEASKLRRRFCNARIQIEEAKLLDRSGNYMQSSESYREAAQNILSIVQKVESEAEREEMGYLSILCQAWQKMAIAEEATSSESYLDAATLFEQAKEHCYTKKASLWALGNSSFCKGLAAGIRYKTSMDMKEIALAKRYIKDAASGYFEAGFENASEYAKASLRLFDAYVFMNQAEGEVDPEKKARQYQMAEQLLQIAAGLFMQAKQPEKTAQVQRILTNVREEKALAVSLSQVIQAPTISSSTLSFSAPSPTSEVSVGLEQFQHANVQANLIVGLREVKVGESFCLSAEFVNAGKEPALLTRVEDFVPPDFIVVKKPEIYRLEENCLNMKGKQIAPLKLVEAKIVLQPLKKGIYQLKPTVHYLNELGQNKSLQLKSIEIKVEEVILADRVSTGTKELDSLLLGGIPKEYSVVLTGPPSDERELIIKNFLEAGIKDEQTSFYVTTEAVGIESLLEKPGFYLFLCNPKPKLEVPDLPNVSRLRSKTDLTNLNIALLKAYRNVEQSSSKRVCINVVSDVLVDYGVKTTRKWIAELTTDLVSKGFTTLAVMNPEMHTPEQTGAVIDLFDGEINITKSDDPQECKKSLLIKKLRGQDYVKNPICLMTS